MPRKAVSRRLALASCWSKAAIGVGVGGPDILPYRPFQRLNSLPLIEKRAPGVIAGMAVQDGNLADRDRTSGHQITVPELYGFAMTRLRLNYIFWGTEEPYYTTEVLPFLRAPLSIKA